MLFHRPHSFCFGCHHNLLYSNRDRWFAWLVWFADCSDALAGVCFFFHFCSSENTLKIANESIQIKGPLCPEALTSQQFRQISDDAKVGKKAKGEWIFTINMHSIHWSYSQQRKCDLDAVPSREMKIGVNDTVSWLPKVPTVLFNSKFSWFEQIQSFFFYFDWFLFQL